MPLALQTNASQLFQLGRQVARFGGGEFGFLAQAKQLSDRVLDAEAERKREEA